MNMLDPQRIAAFFAMPGAVELVEAFSSIPPGPLRETIVAHAKALAGAYEPAAQQSFQQPQPEPMIRWEGPKPAPAPIASIAAPEGVVWRNGRPGKIIFQPAYDQPRKDGKVVHMPPSERFYPFPSGQAPGGPNGHLAAASFEGQIVERALRGETALAIAKDLEIDAEFVFKLMARARKEGVVFPRDADGRVKSKSKASKLMQQIKTMIPTPPEPYWWEDASSPVWGNGHLLPAGYMAEKSPANIGPMTSQIFAQMTTTANRSGRTLQQYVAMRAEVYRRVKGGEPPTKVAAALRQPEHRVYSILTQCGYTAEMAAHEHARPIVGLGGRPG